MSALLLKDGSYQVKGTVRDKNRADKLEPLKEAFGDLYNNLELVEADLMNSDSIIAATEGCDYIVHTACPFPLVEPKNEEEMLRPAVDGTLAVLEGAKKHGAKRVVLTSASSAITFKHPVD